MNWLTSNKKLYPLLVVALALLIVIAAYGPAAAGESRNEPEAQSGASNRILLALLTYNYKHTWRDTIFGVQVYGATTENYKYTPYLLESGASWVRVPILWQRVEPADVAPAQYDWQPVDSALAVAKRESGPRVIATIDNSPGWAADSGGSPLWDSAMADFAEFVGALVERYDGDGLDDAPGSPVVLHWEFYNEPDRQLNYSDPGWGDNPERYAAMLQIAHGAVKGANPNASVIFGGIAHDWFTEDNGPYVRNFLDGVLQNGGGAYFDIMNFHTYPTFSHFWTNHGPGLYQKTQAIRSKMAEYGVDKPIIVTEAGWHSDNPPQMPSSPEMQARYVVQLFTQGLAADLDYMIWWTLYDTGGTAFHNGLVTDGDPPQRKPAFHAYRTMVNLLGNATFEGILSQAQTGRADAEAYRFRDNATQNPIYVAWLNPVNTTASFSLSLPGSQATVSDIYGNGSVVRDADDGTVDGHITLQVGGQPVYVEMNQ